MPRWAVGFRKFRRPTVRSGETGGLQAPMWAERERSVSGKKSRSTLKAFLEPRSPLRSRSATLRSALRSRSIVFCDLDRSPLRSRSPNFRPAPLRFPLRSRSSPPNNVQLMLHYGLMLLSMVNDKYDSITFFARVVKKRIKFIEQ